MEIIRTDADNKDFITLVKLLDVYLAEKDGEEHAFYAQFNSIGKIKHVVIAYENDLPVACGAIKEYAPGVVEVKRMYTSPQHRGKGIASTILKELEKWAAELSYNKCILETGKRQHEAVGLYHRNGYTLIDNYPPYSVVENSLCFEKKLRE